jgi:hypothetical protein
MRRRWRWDSRDARCVSIRRKFGCLQIYSVGVGRKYLDALNLIDPLPHVLVATLTCAAAESTNPAFQNEGNEDFFEAYTKRVRPNTIEDYKEYSEGQRTIGSAAYLVSGTPKITSPSVRQMAFDRISTPAMSAETERVFTGTKLFIPESRGRLGPAVIEALECVRKSVLAGL